MGSIYAPDYLRKQTDPQLHLIADMIEKQVEEIQRLKSWDHFKNTLQVMQGFVALDDNGKNAIHLMMDGLLYRKSKELNLCSKEVK